MDNTHIFNININDIEISELTVRRSNTLKNLNELADSIEKHQLFQPVVLLGKPENPPPYKLISGQRRYLTHKQILKKESIQAVFAGDLSDEQAILHSLIENIHHVELNHVDIANAITALYKMVGKDEHKLQKETGLSIHNLLDYIHI